MFRSSIGSLKHLRYLNLSRNSSLEGLPKSICNLRNLHTLDLSWCYNFIELPKHMRHLRNLRHLFLQLCERITKMPPGIGDLTDLQTLSFFIVCNRKEDDSNLSELQGLDLRGTLELKHLERVRNPKDAEIANLVAKQNLRCLKLMWIDTDVQPPAVAEQVLEALQPHSNLEALKIEGYKGTHLPHWMEDLSVLANVESLFLLECRNCRLHPVLGQLPRLRQLEVYGVGIVEYCDNDLAEVSSSGIVRRFPSLEHMTITHMPNLLGLSRSEESSYERELFPLLHSLFITGCPKLTNLPTSLISLQKLDIEGCQKLTNLPTSLPSLQKLNMEIYCNSVLNCISYFQSLTRLNIKVEGGGVDDVTSFSEGLFRNLAALVYLRLEGFAKLKEFTADLSNLTTLEKLEILYFKELESLPQSLQRARALQSLAIRSCSELPSLPDWLGNLSSLQTLYISDCPQLKSRCEKEKGEDWPKIKHIRAVYMDHKLQRTSVKFSQPYPS